MTGYIIRRLMAMAVNIVLASMLIFVLLRLIPGQASAVLGEEATEEQIAQFEEIHGLNRPVYEQYFDWAGGFLTGDIGRSLQSNVPITDEFVRRLQVTLEIVIISFFVAVTVGLTGGILSAVRQNSFPDYAVRLFAVIGLSTPSFLILTLLLFVPAKFFSYSPPFGATDFFEEPLANLELIAPAAALLAVGSAAPLMRLTRSTLLEVLRQDYIRTARAKGLSERTVIYRHALRNAAAPLITAASLQLGFLLGGTVILEFVMAIPGLGGWTLLAVGFKDYPVIMAVAMYSAIIVMLINLVVDISYAVLDPRIRYT